MLAAHRVIACSVAQIMVVAIGCGGAGVAGGTPPSSAGGGAYPTSPFPSSSASPGARVVHWNGKLAAGKTMEVRTVMGTVRAVAATDDIAAIDATVSPTANGDSNTSMRVREDDHGVLLRTERDDDDRCGDHGQHVQPVDVVVRVPAGVRLVVHTVDARIDADGLKGTAVLHTVDGTIDARGLSSVEAGTVDGSIHVAFAQPDLAEDTVVSTVNGTVDVTLPPTENAELAASTINGLIRVDMPPSGVESSHRLRLTLGHGGRSLRLRTVNGAIHVKRAS